MPVECPNCNHIRTPKDDRFIPKWKCPKCDIVYAKFKNGKAVEKPIINDSPAEKPRQPEPKQYIEDTYNAETINHKAIIVAGILCFVLGYFAGREHLKYEMNQAVSAAVNTFKKDVSNIFSGNRSIAERTQSVSTRQPDYKTKTNKPQPIKLLLIKKGFRYFDSDIGNDAITFTFEFTNLLEKEIRAFKGSILFSDILDNKIKSLSLSYTTPIPVGETNTYIAELDYNQFIESHRALKSTEMNDLNVIFVLKTVLFTDGTKEEF